MELTTLFLIFLVLALPLLIFAFSKAIVKAYNNIPIIKKAARQRRNKAQLRQVIYRYRLSKMLHYIGIRVTDFVDRIPPYEVRKHIIRCKRCPNITTCDACLRDGRVISDMHFCPNYESLMAYSWIMPALKLADLKRG
jgi:hypothetical protein